MKKPWGGWPFWSVAPLAVFLLFVLGCPLADGLSVGGDDGFELSKSLLLARDPQAARGMWNDQPWLHTMLTAGLFRVLGENAAIPRVFSLLSALALLVATGHLLKRTSGVWEHVLVGIFLLSADQMPIFALAAMTELPAIAWAVVAVAIAHSDAAPTARWRLLLSGAVFALATHIKLTAVIVLPAFAVVCLSQRGLSKRWKALSFWVAGFGAVFALIAAISPTFNYEQLWLSHRNASTALTVSERALYSFPTSHLAENSALMLAAALGAWRGLTTGCQPVRLFALTLLVTSALVAALQRPWWPYYVVHLHVPMSILGAVGAGWVFRQAVESLVASRNAPSGSAGKGEVVLDSLESSARSNQPSLHVIAASGICALWIGFALPHFLSELRTLREVPTASSTEICRVMKHFAENTRWCFAEASDHAFGARLPVLPELVVFSKKRFWSGNLTDEIVRNELIKWEPEQILLPSHSRLTRESEFLNWLRRNYVLTELDTEQNLWIKRSLNPSDIAAQREERLRKVLQEFGL